MSRATTTLVDKVAGALSARMGRRGFFARSAVVGSAIAANPVSYALTPTDAYAAVCSCQGQACACGSLCCDGYTEFCCTLTGRNQCPPGSLLAGWWKVDGTGFCSGPRYYMDCNAPCNGCGCGGSGVCSGSCSGTGCGCANGDCNNRKAGCTNFRYGQCNQGVACVGPIICRLVTCIAPWEIDGTCTGTIRVDNATATHDRSCLHGVTGQIDSATEVSGGIRVKGWAIDWDTNASVDVRLIMNSEVVAVVRADRPRSDIAAAHPGMGPNHGFDVVLPGSQGGQRQVCAVAVNIGPGSDGIIGCRTVVSRNPFGVIDNVTVGTGKVTVEGWAIDPDTTNPIDVHVYVAGKGVAVRADRRRADLDVAFGMGADHGFRVTIDVPQGRHRVDVYAINVGGGSGNVLLGSRTIEVGTPIGTVERVDPAPGGLRVRGWARDPDTTDPIQVHLYVAGKGLAVLADDPRPALSSTSPSTNHGFDVVVPAPPGSHELVAYAINDRPGPNALIAVRPVNVLSGAPFGALDVVRAGPGKIAVAGWLLDPDSSDPVDVHVYVDGVGHVLRADRRRSDVAAAYPGYGSARGFSAELPASSGLRTVCAYGINLGPGSNSLIGCRSVLVGGSPFGSLDVARGGSGTIRLQGWAIDPDTAGPIDVHVYVDGVGAGVATASKNRSDVGAAHPLYGPSHGFDVTVGASRGSRTVCVYLINRGRGDNVLLACRSVRVS
ncbi:hypothetical protein [Rhabdothermincola salaria]|uniref:hypothetical protein n=1 Tax=Rhabdothermincola salaria TaxID=2903142 RepID=UPI001E28EF64|nr:hypothetical protein [Rhabdothermincola salaria]MCD9623881.1 hypothetical protein [Rhabdothermincola salaria]